MKVPSGSSTRRLVVAVDLDEVLGRFLESLLQYHNTKYETTWKVADFFSYRFCDVWGGTNEEATEKVYAFFETDHFKKGVAPLPGAREVLQKYKDAVDFYIVTSRQHVILQETENWVERHYPQLFKGILAGNHWTRENTGVVTTSESNSTTTTSSKARSKAEMCREIRANVLIDDSPSYISDCLQNAGEQFEKAIVFGEYGWNANFDAAKAQNALRCKNWSEVDAFLEKRVQEQQMEQK